MDNKDDIQELIRVWECTKAFILGCTIGAAIGSTVAFLVMRYVP